MTFATAAVKGSAAVAAMTYASNHGKRGAPLWKRGQPAHEMGELKQQRRKDEMDITVLGMYSVSTQDSIGSWKRV